MTRLLLLLLALLFATNSATAADPLPAREPLAVLIYADWCYNCKLLMPKLAQARAGLTERYRFVTLDVTDEPRKLKAKQTAIDLGFMQHYMGNHATGMIMLIDAKGAKLGEIKQDMSVEQIRAALQAFPPG